MHLVQSGFTYSASESFTKNKEKIQKTKETGDSIRIYQNKLNRTWFKSTMAYGYFKDSPRRAASDKVLYDTTFNIPKNPKCDEKTEVLLQWYLLKLF